MSTGYLVWSFMLYLGGVALHIYLAYSAIKTIKKQQEDERKR